MSEPTPQSVAPSLLDTVLDNAELVLATLEGLGGAINPAVPAVATLLAKVERTIAAGIKAHERITGQPLDLSKLHHIEELP